MDLHFGSTYPLVTHRQFQKHNRNLVEIIEGYNCTKTIRGQTETSNVSTCSAIQCRHWSQWIEVNSQINMRMFCPRASTHLNFPTLKLFSSWNTDPRMFWKYTFFQTFQTWSSLEKLMLQSGYCMTISLGHDHSTQNNSVGQLCCIYGVRTCCIHINDDANTFRSACIPRQICRSQSQSNEAGNKSAEYSVDRLMQYIQRSPHLWYEWVTIAILHWYALVLHKQRLCDFSFLLPNFPSEFVYLDVKQSTLMTTENIQKFANRHFNLPSIATSQCQAVRPSGMNFVNNDQWLWLTVTAEAPCQLKE